MMQSDFASARIQKLTTLAPKLSRNRSFCAGMSAMKLGAIPVIAVPSLTSTMSSSEIVPAVMTLPLPLSVSPEYALMANSLRGLENLSFEMVEPMRTPNGWKLT
jgi:hypothetical protein